MKCTDCGSHALIEGSLLDTSGGSEVGFTPDSVSAFKKMFGIGARGVRAYGCIHCQHLQLAVNFTEEDSQNYQQFEGEQPDVLERINSEADEMGK